MANPNGITPDTPGAPFFARWNAFVRELNIDPSVKLVARTMADHADDQGKQCAPGSNTLALETSYSKRTIYNALVALKELGIVVRTKQGVPWQGTHDEYQLLIPSNWEDVLRAGDKPQISAAPEPHEAMPVILFEGNEETQELPPAPPQPEQRRKKKAKQQRDNGPTVLYRYYDEEDLLLYIGISNDMRHRLSGHEKASTWMDFAVRSTIERFPTRDEAEAAEREQIGAHRPLFNSQFNDYPERQKNLVEYLIGKGRYDLLAANVSRG
ncbi:helix-turn-helix domain-containing protein [Nocardiopsis sp. NPDC006139]|uniref:helix-turn-helix domain-containing protein n=1 Tax=Nocardiopsis sp. NPDC006139 TaxID=3154578 RepID=UPI0033BA35D1